MPNVSREAILEVKDVYSILLYECSVQCRLQGFGTTGELAVQRHQGQCQKSIEMVPASLPIEIELKTTRIQAV